MKDTESHEMCPVCREQPLRESPRPREDFFRAYDCPRCGRFRLDDFVHLEGKHFERVRHLASAWIRQQNKAEKIAIFGKNIDCSYDEWPLQFERMGFPSTVDERMNALLKAYADNTEGELEKKLSANEPSLVAEVAAKNLKEIEGLTNFLYQLGWVEFDSHTDTKPKITARGWLHVDELRRSKEVGDTAFIAVWFDRCTEEYRKAACFAVEGCGYKAVIVNQEEFNGFIMDKVVSLIRQSRFVIADFTCRPEEDNDGDQKVRRGVRGGVYWEAGMAFGMDKPVIHTCEADEFARKRIHFDVDQYSTIYWKADNLGTEIGDMSGDVPNPTLVQSLAVRILRTVGRGSVSLASGGGASAA